MVTEIIAIALQQEQERKPSGFTRDQLLLAGFFNQVRESIELNENQSGC